LRTSSSFFSTSLTSCNSFGINLVTSLSVSVFRIAFNFLLSLSSLSLTDCSTSESSDFGGSFLSCVGSLTSLTGDFSRTATGCKSTGAFLTISVFSSGSDFGFSSTFFSSNFGLTGSTFFSSTLGFSSTFNSTFFSSTLGLTSSTLGLLPQLFVV